MTRRTRALRPPGLPFHAVQRLDSAIVDQVARIPRGPWDPGFAWLTRAATHSKLWIGVAAALALKKGTSRRAGAHGLIAVALASAGVNILAKRLLPRARPHPESLPIHRFLHPQPTSSSLPSGHSASAVAFATGVGLVSPALGALLAPVAAGVAYSRIHTGAHWPSDVMLGSAFGASAALVTRAWWSRLETAPPARATPARAPALPDSEGLAIVVNPASGPQDSDPVAEVRDLFPKAVIEVIGKDELAEDLARILAAAPGVRALGVWGGDGTIGPVAGVCAEMGLPLAVLPGGTFNHFARDIGTLNAEGLAAAVASGQGRRCDLGRVTVVRGNPGGPEEELVMLNTASVGVYPNLVRRRDHLTRRLPGLPKRAAATLAALRTFGAATPTRLVIGGVRRRVWTLFIGRGLYWPRDIAPLERPVVDDGVLDLRAVSARPRFARLRLLTALVTGTVERSPVARIWLAEEVTLEASDRPIVLAVDGEVVNGVVRARIRVEAGALTVYSPLEGD
ncbi:bifunctional phosphatase PAP2/diacylglycerol kinase family protein [Sinomonas notoginsengisoli]|uniref:bifunctional phosphatase PAP2/diacylglycerol kinase family protein n=1 Tax=Sinomonas notoginsengisoli TaxID=1457311 RepID=UPI001F1BDDB5|nr:bifunctional phosphatase PAP2/diacylglycerol kinase family protein [Sinomonas notoginsengisoli]